MLDNLQEIIYDTACIPTYWMHAREHHNEICIASTLRRMHC